MVRYVKCPRCELNYIDEETQEFCDVCLSEMRGSKLKFADLDDEELEEQISEFDEVCPVCGVNRLRPGEKMCESCRQQQEYDEEEDVDPEKDEEWKNYLEEEDDGDLTVDDADLQELEEEFGDDEESDDEMYEGDDEEDPLDDFDDFDDDDLDDDEEDDEEDEDDDDF